MEVYDFISETNLSQAISQMSLVLKTDAYSLSASQIPWMVSLQRLLRGISHSWPQSSTGSLRNGNLSQEH